MQPPDDQLPPGLIRDLRGVYRRAVDVPGAVDERILAMGGRGPMRDMSSLRSTLTLHGMRFTRRTGHATPD